METRDARREAQPFLDGVGLLKEVSVKAPSLEGVPTGVEGLDELFFFTEWRNGKPLKKPLGGIPKYSVMQITGVSDTGKSLMVEQFAVEQARRGFAVAFITMESPAPFVAMGLKQRAMAMGVPFDEVESRVVFIDGATYSVLRSDVPTLLSTLAHVIKTYKTEFVVMDSITSLYESREMMARDIVRPVFNFLKKWHQTALLVSQKRSGHELLTAEAAGGYAVGHILDGSIVLGKQTVTTSTQSRLYGVPVGETVRLLLIDGCRLAGHDSRTHIFYITDEGLVRVGPALSELTGAAKM